MDVNDLKLFTRAAELGNITRAAAELGYTQSAASHALRRLEQSLGTQLLQRLHMGVCLTENGRALLPYAAAMLTAQERLIQKAGELSDRVSGTVSVGCISSVAIRWLPELIEHMARRFPAVQIRFQDGSYEDVETWILKKKVDVGFLSAATKQPFRLTPLVEDELLLVLPHGHELCALEEVPPEQLRQQRERPVLVLQQHNPGSGSSARSQRVVAHSECDIHMCSPILLSKYVEPVLTGGNAISVGAGNSCKQSGLDRLCWPAGSSAFSEILRRIQICLHTWL